MDRIHRLMGAGVDAFIDLTQDGELAPYEPYLPPTVAYQRWPIRDHSLPDSPGHMAEILDALDALLAEGRCVYVHCRAGIGRTGTAIGCHLIRSGLDANAAMDHLQTLWKQNARSASWPTTPETDEQYHFVLEWRETRRVVLDVAQRREGALLGLACADSIATLLAANRYSPAQLLQQTVAPGVTLDVGPSTLTTTAVAESLLERRGHDAQDQMQRYLQISRTHANLLSADFRRALATWQWSRKPNAGSHDPKNLDSHPLPRSLAAAFFKQEDAAAAIELGAEISRTTQQSPVVLDLCRFWTALFVDALDGVDRTTLLDLRTGVAMQILRGRKLRAEVEAILEGRAAVSRGFDALSATAQALAAFGRGQDFVEGLRLSLEGGEVAAALYGAIAGAHAGSASIPASWLQALPQQQALRSIARRFA
ncbi:ADP-ribosylglycohydrolase [Povalibacter uvarum]|uniref:ADP-ribosylglycohydrolase n=2 Tax=Povalibacter uvarum TaxID=732238 RepID=A0A841HSG8_9GAMM|nr:ADP-ribosylglycohydrolase family protein [Povalibacter uvarum]MBB6094815.1 ADP-ribosylglycohydrolase [Povalibacter uvarum]